MALNKVCQSSLQRLPRKNPTAVLTALSLQNLVLSLLFLLPATLRATPLLPRDDSTVQGVLGTDSFWNDYDGGMDNYTFYSGDGSASDGWPSVLSWISFNDMWTTNQHVMQRSCDIYYNTSNNSADELTNLRYAIKQVAQETRVDHRFILAAVMQETKGCVRAVTSVSQDGVRNPGILQDFKGSYSCNDNGKVQNPCPHDQILGMIRDGGMSEHTLSKPHWAFLFLPLMR